MSALLIVLGVAAVIAVVVIQFVLKQKRRDELAQFATTYGMEYSRTDLFGLVDPTFRLFQQGDGRGCENVVWGNWHGAAVREADYWYYTESTDSNGNRTKTYHRFTVALVDIEAFLPYVRVEKEGLLSTVTHHLGFHDVDFESEEFNRTFNVTGEDREFTFKLIDERMMQWLLSTGGQFGFEVRGPRFLAYCRRLPPAGLVPAFGAAQAFRDHIPRLVWSEYGPPGQAGESLPGQRPAAAPTPQQPVPAAQPAPAARPARLPPVPAPAGQPTFVNDIPPGPSPTAGPVGSTP